MSMKPKATPEARSVPIERQKPRLVSLSIASIRIDGRVLRTDPKNVRSLVASIGELGLINPISVFIDNKTPVLVAGRHRLEACRQLGHKTIMALVEKKRGKVGRPWALMAEIDENLMRRKLSPAIRAKLTTERKRVYEMLHPETKQGGAPGKAGGGKAKAKAAKSAGFATDTARKTGRSERVVQLDAHRGEELGPEALDRIAGTSLDKGEQLDALAHLPANERDALIEKAASGEHVVAFIGDEAKEVSALLSAWKRASQSARQQFMDRVGLSRLPLPAA